MTRCGCNVQIMDSSMHRLKNKNSDFVSRGYDEVVIDHDTWLAANVTVMQGTHLPPFSVVAAHSMCNDDYRNNDTHSLFAGIPAKYKTTGIWRDINDDNVTIDLE